MPINIAIAEDNSFALSALEQQLQSYPEITIKAVARTGQQMIDILAKRNNIDLILMDIEMPVMDGVSATAEIKRRYPHIKIIMLTMFEDEERLFNAIMSGASGYLLKGDSAIQIQQCILDTIAGGAAMSASMAMKALNLLRNPIQAQVAPKDFGLTDRELQLIEQLKNGLTYEEIAANLHISYHTVRKHIENIYRKLQVNNKVEAVKKAADHRIV